MNVSCISLPERLVESIGTIQNQLICDPLNDHNHPMAASRKKRERAKMKGRRLFIMAAWTARSGRLQRKTKGRKRKGGVTYKRWEWECQSSPTVLIIEVKILFNFTFDIYPSRSYISIVDWYEPHLSSVCSTCLLRCGTVRLRLGKGVYTSTSN